jgi:hypothetical protein
LLEQARAAAKEDVSLGNDVALTDAAMHAYRDDFDGAAKIVIERIRVAAQRNDGSEYDLHDVLIFVSEARDDKAAALFEALEMRSVAEPGRRRSRRASASGTCGSVRTR